jgi:hypothetical protein
MKKLLMLTVVITLVTISGYANKAKTASLKNDAFFTRLKSNSRLLTNFTHSDVPTAIIDKRARHNYMMERLKEHHLMFTLQHNSRSLTQFLQKKSAATSLLWGGNYNSYYFLAADADSSLFNHTLYNLSPGYYYINAFMTTPLASPYHNDIDAIGVVFYATGSNGTIDDSYILDGHETNPTFVADDATAYYYTPYIDWSQYDEVGIEWSVFFKSNGYYADVMWDIEAPFTGHP